MARPLHERRGSGDLLYQHFIQNGTNQIAAFLCCHGHVQAQILRVVIKHHVLNYTSVRRAAQYKPVT